MHDHNRRQLRGWVCDQRVSQDLRRAAFCYSQVIILPTDYTEIASSTGISALYHSSDTPRWLSPLKEARAPRSRGRSVVVLYNGVRTHRSLNKDAPV